MSLNKDSRRDSRLKTLKAGKILLTGGWGSHECVVKNLSKTGAKIEVDPLFDFPSQFELLVIQDKTLTSCTLAWRQGKLAGVQFLAEAKHIDLKDYRF